MQTGTLNSTGVRIVLWMELCPSSVWVNALLMVLGDGAYGKYLGLDKVMKVKGEPVIGDWISGILRREPGRNLSPLCENTVRRQHLHVKRRAVI